jgi:UDP-2,3-diacylglucosamine hydrolase
VQKYFVSDLHLDSSRPDATNAFLAFLAADSIAGQTLYILGDLFEYWVDDSDNNPEYRRVTEAIRRFTSASGRCFIMHGNRDFMLGGRFMAESGAVLLPDPTLISVGGQSVLVSHGDIYCTDDAGYQRYRRIVRHPQAQRIYNALPMALKQKVAARIRGTSKANYGAKRPDILDVNQDAVEAALREHRVETMVHGHTHRPAIHKFELDGREATRIVLGDWYDQGSILVWDAGGPRLSTLAFAGSDEHRLPAQ